MMNASDWIAGSALLVSLFSLWLSRSLWAATHRPVVSAAIRTHAGSNHAIAYDLAVTNSGGRPAVRVRLSTNKELLDACLEASISAAQREAIHGCFWDRGEIPVLLSGQSVTNSFGCTTGEKLSSAWLYASRIPVEIRYQDLEGKKYATEVDLIVKDSSSFAGTQWGN